MNNIEFIKNGGVATVDSFSVSSVNAGIYKEKEDLAFIKCDVLCNAAAVYTTNLVKAAPIYKTIENLENGKARAVLINSGNANACAPNGKENVDKLLEKAEEELKVSKEDFIINSTGIIGVELPIEKIIKSLPKLNEGLCKNNINIAKAIMTTDTYPKHIAVKTKIQGKTITIGGISKGSGMIHPNMATMLAVITTDCNISIKMLQTALSESVEKSYNRISVDGDQSTNDMCTILASCTAEHSQIVSKDEDYYIFLNALDELNLYLAKSIIKDGEGASRFITCNIKNATNEENATLIVKSVISSSLVKTAMFAADANWGRILAAMGYSKGFFEENKVDINFISNKGSINVCKNGMGVNFNEAIAKSILSEKEIIIDIDLKIGEFSSYAFGCDLTYEYVKINGEYRS
ncbi:MAG: bifunctional glutamate N-acetyltransferase/amino-acid acetyltransferase ArgJ [Defluviitaleaceae bacterium]|nr:bifunctional glutamate N-acetyltransferase/amino-acid acetyltransferase ArgJ [Defluviitaleaceae bacterium]